MGALQGSGFRVLGSAFEGQALGLLGAGVGIRMNGRSFSRLLMIGMHGSFQKANYLASLQPSKAGSFLLRIGQGFLSVASLA